MTPALELFFVDIRLLDVLEIVIVAFVLYQLFRLMRGTIAVQIFFGLLALYLLDVIVSALNLNVLQAVFSRVGDVFVLAIIILFQPEIRRLLLAIGKNPLVSRWFMRPDNQTVDGVIDAVKTLSQTRTGALIAFARVSGLRTYIETGAPVDARVTPEMLTQLFVTNSPLHDGAAIVVNNRIAAARCILPVSQNKSISGRLGLRHRAALGLSEQSDAFVVVVSEERGSISVAENGELTFNLPDEEFRERLTEALSASTLAVEEQPVATDA